VRVQLPPQEQFAAEESEAAVLRRELAAANQANQDKQAALARLQHRLCEQQSTLLSQIDRWKSECAEYKSDAERFRRWRRVRQKIAPDGSLRHLMLVAVKSVAKRTFKWGSQCSQANFRNAHLLLKCEQPDLSANATVSGFSYVRGWAWPRSGIERIEVLIDGIHVGNAFHGFARPDVSRSYPEFGSDINLGFGFRFDARTLSTGMHVLRIIAVGKNAEIISAEGNLEVTSQQENQEQTFNRAQAEFLDNTNGNSHHRERHSSNPPSRQSVDASVVIFARNQAEYLSRSLPVIAGQKTSFKFEIIGFDTQSDDGTPQVFRRHGARVICVGRNEFHHVNTRLQSLKEARGEFVIFVVGDALPADGHWLEGLVRPLIDDPLVAAAYSRQIPAPGCVPWEARDIYLGCSVVREVKQVDWSEPAEIENYRNHQWKFISFSDVSASYRRTVLETVPLLEGLPEVEDQYWCKCLLEEGYRVVLEPTSIVIHSHNHSLRELYRRQRQFGRCFATFMDVRPEPIRRFISGMVIDTTNDLLFIAGYKANWLLKGKWLFQAPVMRFVKRFGLRQGFRLGGFGVEGRRIPDLSRTKAPIDAVPLERSK
jgi:glycosyltransferase involved in cell wall biosynthesis